MIFWSKQGSVDFFAVADNFNGLFIVLGFVFPELTKKKKFVMMMMMILDVLIQSRRHGKN